MGTLKLPYIHILFAQSTKVLTDVTELLHDYGPWAMLVLVGAYVLYKDKRIREKDKEIKEINEYLFGVLEEDVEARVKLELTLKELRKTIERDRP